MVSTNGKVLESDEERNMLSTDGKSISTIIGNVYGIKLGIGVRTEWGSLDSYNDGFNDYKLDGLLIGG